MRSRFCAYRLKQVDYLVETTHPDSRTAKLRLEVEETVKQVEWLSLKVVSTSLGNRDDKNGKVEFRADYRMDGQPHTHHERSRFRRYEGRWKYLDDRG